MNKIIPVMKQRRVTHNFFKTLFLIVILLTVTTDFSKAAISLTQQIKEKRVTLNIEKKSIVYILTEIQKQTKINFGFNEDLNPTNMGLFSVNAKDKSVEEILKLLFTGTKYRYTIADDKILIEEIVPSATGTKQVAQKRSIKGKIIDEDKQPIVGATVIVPGTSNGAITNERGEFSIQTIKGESLEVSFTGMKPQIIKINSDQNLVIIMKRSMIEVDDVVVTGYGAIKRSSFTGSSVMVKREDLLKASKTNVIQALQTFDPSFRIKENNQWGSDPNSLPEVYIRGESGIGVKELDKTDLTKSTLKDNPNLPTFIMDGFEISVTK
ncbi:MAG: carboxypeptidase-like regulatory domain-containing protein, partial [Rikenellaceae bacterium]